MNIRSAKAKGRRLCEEAREIILSVFEELREGDVRVNPASCPGPDLWLSPAAKEKIKLVFEMKNQERVNIWAAIAQAKNHSSDGEACPVVVISKNREPEPYAVIALKDLLGLIKK